MLHGMHGFESSVLKFSAWMREDIPPSCSMYDVYPVTVR